MSEDTKIMIVFWFFLAGILTAMLHAVCLFVSGHGHEGTGELTFALVLAILGIELARPPQ